MNRILRTFVAAVAAAGALTVLAARPVHAADAADAVQAGASDLAIVVNPATPVDKLTFAELREVFLGNRQYWSPDMPVVLLIRAPTSAERDAVLNIIYQMQEPQFKQYWIAKIFKADLSSPPKIVYSNDSANTIVQNVPGAIAFIPAKDVLPGLKVLRIDGRLPGDPGYRLHLTPKK
jgi:ABC-type phosphate transport system substrate-binding protein